MNGRKNIESNQPISRNGIKKIKIYTKLIAKLRLSADKAYTVAVEVAIIFGSRAYP